MDAYAALESPLFRDSPPRLFDRLPYEIGRWVDQGALLLEAWRIGRADDEALKRRAERYRRAVGFLEESGLLAEPTRLFAPPRCPRSVERRRRSVLGLPAFESIRFASEAVAIFPQSFGTAARDSEGRNDLARAWLWRHGDHGRTTVLCVHGYRGGFPALDARAFGVGQLFGDLGLDVALAVLPYHGPRAPAGSASGAFFLSDPRRTIEAVVQGISDLRALIGWIREEGAGRIGVMGLSLGGYMTALLASLDNGLDFAVPVIPVASFADILWDRAGRRGEHVGALAAGIDLSLLRRLFAPHCPLGFRPLVPHERRLVIAGAADRIAPPEHAAALAAHWQAEVEWFPGGHLAQLGRGRAFRRLALLAARG